MENEAARWFSADDEPALADFWSVYEQHRERLLPPILASLDSRTGVGVAAPEHERALLHARHFLRVWCSSAVEQCDGAPDSLLECQAFFEPRGAGVEEWAAACCLLQSELTPYLLGAYGSEPSRLAASLRVLQRYASQTQAAVARGFLRRRDQLLALEREQKEQATTRFTRLAESGILGIIVCDFHGNIVEANDGFLQTFGYSREELRAGTVRWAGMTPEEWKHLDDDAIQQLLSAGKTRPWEKEYFHKDGSRIPILVGVAMLNETQTIAFVLDISERKRLEEIRNRSLELETQNRRIQEASRLKSEFLANMSHELRTPLNSILGFTELLHDREIEPSSPQYFEFLEDILKSGRHLQQLINDVLDLAKVEAGKIELRPERVDVAQLIGEVCAVLRTVAASKQIRVETTVAPEVRSATLDPARFKQVLYNYLSNALKFTPDGGQVRVRALDEPEDCMRLIVEDTGVGIASADLGRLFVEFQQLEAGATKKHAGTGLGLALTKRLVEAQGGSVGVKSVLGQGSQFFAILPLHARSEGEPAESAALDPAPALGAASVLVVEDDARDRALLVQTLSRAGYGVTGAGTGGQAIAWCMERSFDAITLDLLLPDMTGLDVLHRVRLEGRNRETPVVVVSVVAEQGTMAGFTVQDYLTKPFDGRDLIAALERAQVTPHKGGSILVVDDEPAAHRLMCATLEKLGCAVRCCSNGAEALAEAARERPLAVVLDLMMPGVDGFEFLVRFRAESENRSVPIIVWTMKDLTAEDVSQLRQLAQRVIAKDDWTPSAFVQEVQGLIAEQRSAIRWSQAP